MDNNTPLTIIAITTAVSGKEAELRAAQERLVEETLQEPGCLKYELHQSTEDGRILIFVESWASRDYWQDHMNGQAIKNFQQAEGGKLLADVTIHQMVQVAG